MNELSPATCSSSSRQPAATTPPASGRVHETVVPAALLAHRGEDRPHGASDPQAPVGDEQPRRSQPSGLEISEQHRPALRRLPIPALIHGLHRRPRVVLADAGYWSEANVVALQERGIEPLIATGRRKHSEPVPVAPRGRPPVGLTVKQRMARRLAARLNDGYVLEIQPP